MEIHYEFSGFPLLLQVARARLRVLNAWKSRSSSQPSKPCQNCRQKMLASRWLLILRSYDSLNERSMEAIPWLHVHNWQHKARIRELYVLCVNL